MERDRAAPADRTAAEGRTAAAAVAGGGGGGGEVRNAAEHIAAAVGTEAPLESDARRYGLVAR